MIAKVEGTLDAIEHGAALVRIATPGVGGLTYGVLLPSFTAARLAGSVGSPVTLHTLQFIESLNQGATLVPRLAGFLSTEDRRFYELFVTCKGIGHRRALRAMTLATDQIAAAIADRDLALLQSLPEIGRRTAETIVATLRGKVDPFVAAAAYAGSPTGSTSEAPARRAGTTLTREALGVLLTLGENRTQAIAWIDQVLAAADDDEQARPTDAQQIIARVYQIKSGQ